MKTKIKSMVFIILLTLSLLSGEEAYQELAQEYREQQMELEYYEGSAAAGMFDSLVSHVGHEAIGIANTAISASNAFWKAVHWFNIPAKLYGLDAPEAELISTEPFDTYLERNAARIWDMDVYYAGRCGGDVVIGAVDLAAMVKGLANLPGALEDLLNGIGSLSGGSPQLQLVGGSVQAAAGGCRRKRGDKRPGRDRLGKHTGVAVWRRRRGLPEVVC